MLKLVRQDQETAELQRRLLVIASSENNAAVLEFIAGGGQENIEDRLGETAT